MTARKRDHARAYRMRCDREEGPTGPDECVCGLALRCVCNDCLACELRAMRSQTTQRREGKRATERREEARRDG